jgi:hypothetical protein
MGSGAMKTWGDVGILVIGASLISGCYAGVGTGGQDDEDGPGAESEGESDSDGDPQDDTGGGPDPLEPEEECVDTRNDFDEEI